jgi:hypothetical protein
VKRDRAKYEHAPNNDVDLDGLVRAMCLVSLAVFKEPVRRIDV